MSFVVPKCSHDNIILDCPDDDCHERQVVMDNWQKMRRDFAEHWQEMQLDVARRLIHEALGWVDETPLEEGR